MQKTMTIFILALLISCNEDSNYSISGNIENAEGIQQVYISELNKNNNQTTVIDTVEVVDGKFETDLPERENPTLSFLTLDRARGNVLFIAENAPINMEINRDSLFASKVTGGEHNEILYDYLGNVMETNKKISNLRGEMMAAHAAQDSDKLEELQQEQQEIITNDQEKKKNFVQNNSHSIVAVLVLQDMINSKIFDNTELRELFKNLSPEVRETYLGQTLEKGLSAASSVDVGNKAPLFSAPTPGGEELALEDVLGKVTLVDFWASWCKPCREENPNIVRVYEKYHDKGFNILGVSLDRPGQRDKWLQAIEDDNLTWNQVSNLMFWQDPVAQKYNIRAIPAAFLLDENGVIVAKNLRGEALERKVAELLEEE